MLLGSVRSVMAVMVRCVAMGIGRDGCRAMWQDFCKGGVLSGLTRLGKAVTDRRGGDAKGTEGTGKVRRGSLGMESSGG